MKKLSFFLMAMLFTCATTLQAAEVTETIAMKGFGGLTTTSYENVTKTGTSDLGTEMVAYAFNPTNGQIRGNKTAIAGASVTTVDKNKNWSLYNTQAMPGAIKKITVTQTATGSNMFKGKLFVALGTTNQGAVTTVTGAQQNTTGTATEFTFDIDTTQGYTYFKLLSNVAFTGGSVAGAVVTVTYVTAEGGEEEVTKYTVTANVNDPAMGSVSGAGEYAEGKTATLTANANAGYRFVNWSNGSTDNPLKITVTENIEITANFEAVPPMTCAEAAAAASGATVVLNPFDVVAVVKDAGYIYIEDESGVNLIYDYNLAKELKAGDHVEGFVGVSSPYNGLPELKPSVAFADLTVTPGTAPEPTLFTEVPTKADLNKYVKFENVTLTANATFTTSSATNATMVVNGTNVTLRNNFKLAATLSADKAYNIVGFAAIYNSTIQVYYLSAEEYVAPVVNHTITVSANPAEAGTVTGGGEFEETDEITVEAVANDGYEFVNWTENDVEVSTEANYSFAVLADRNLVANFKEAEPEIEWMEMELEMANLVTEVKEIENAKYLSLTASDIMSGAEVMLFLNNYADVDDDYEVNAGSSLITFAGFEFTVLEGTISQTSETENGTIYTGTVYAYTGSGDETMYAAFAITMYAAPATVLVLTDAIVAINEELGTLTFNVPTGEDEGYYAELANYTAPGVHEGPQICVFMTPEAVAFTNYAETSVVDGVITLTGEFTSPNGPKFDLTISGTLPVVEEPEVEKPEPTYTENNLNPYAFGLESKLSADKETLTVTYRLNNSNATSVNVVVYNGEEVVATVAGTTTIGKNTVEVATADLPGGVELTWGIEVNGTSVDAPTREEKIYSFYHPSGLDIDNNPENATFGMLLINEGMQAVKGSYQNDGSPYVSTNLGAGIFAFTPSFDLIPNGELPGYNGGIEFTTGRADGSGTAYSPRRIRISEDGRIFVTSLNTDGNYLWEVNPANMNEWTTVFKGTLNENKELVDAEGNFIAAPNTGFDVKGSGENLQLAMYSVNLSGITAAAMGGFRLHEYNLGTATEWTTAPSKAIVEGKYAINYTGTQVEYDNEGGLWICSYRGAANDANPGLVHINKDGVEDAKLVWNNVRQAGIRFNKDFTKLVVAGNNGAAKKATIYTISKDANGAPVLTQEAVVDMAVVGNNLNDFAWDYAGNLYSCGNSSEKLAAWAMPYSGTVETPAASKYAFELDYNVMDITMTNLEVQEMGELVVLTASDELNTGLNVTLAINKDGSINEMSYASIIAGWMETELPILEGTITKTYSEELATDVYSGLVVVEYFGAKLGLNLTMYATPAIDVVIENATITVEEKSDGVGGTYELINVSAPWGESMLVIEGIEKNHEGFVQITEIFMVDGEEDLYFWMCENAVVTTVDNVLTVTGRFRNNYIGVSYNVTISGNLPQGPGTALENATVTIKTVKMIKNNQLIIRKGDVEYNVQGQVIK